MSDRIKEKEQFLLEELEYKNRLINKVYSLLELINTDADNVKIYDNILRMAIHTIKNASYGSILVLGEDNVYDFVSLIGFKKEKFSHVRLRPEQTSIYRATAGLMDKSRIINEIFKYNKNNFDEDISNKILNASEIDIKTTLSVPIWDNQEPIAVLNLDSSEENAFDESDIKDLEIFAMGVSNVIKIRELMKSKDYMNTHDELTGIYNRRYFNQIVDNLLKDNQKFSMVFFDLDNLKEVNDYRGHLYGDYYIKEFAETADKIVSKHGTFFRFAGDEFIILTQENADKIMNEVNKEFNSLRKEKNINISYSYGISTYPDEGKNFDEIFRVADKRMYNAKSLKKRH